MPDRIEKHGLKISPALFHFIEKEGLPGSGVDPDKFWAGFAALAVKLMPLALVISALSETCRRCKALSASGMGVPASSSMNSSPP